METDGPPYLHGRRGRAGRGETTAQRREYDAARWPALVRTLRVAGCGPGQAARLASAALATSAGRSRTGDWSDPDVAAYAAAGDAWRAERRRAVVPDPTPPYDDPVLTALLERLDDLDADRRWRWVLRHVAGLGEEQVDELVAAPDGPEPAEGPAVDWPGAVRTGPVPVSGSPGRTPGAGRVSRRTAWTAAVLVVVIAAAAALVAGSWHGGGSGSASSVGPVPVAWWSDGALHVGDRTVRIAGVRSMAQVPGTVVLVDGDGVVDRVDTRGRVTVLGRARPGGEVVGGDAQRLAAWIDPRGRVLVVYDLGSATDVARVVVGRSAEVVAVDAQNVFYRDSRGDHDLLIHSVDLTVPKRLLDVEAGVRAAAYRGSRVRIAGQGVGPFVRRGSGVLISPYAQYAAVLTPGRALTVLALADGSPVSLPLPTGPVVAEAFDPLGELVVAVSRGGSESAGDDESTGESGADLVVCDVGRRRCTVAGRLPAGSTPVLAHW